MQCKNPVRWYGGKSKLATKILPLLPVSPSSTLCEPFFGTGAVTFAALEGGLASVCHACDLNQDVVNFYTSIRKPVTRREIHTLTEIHSVNHSYDYFLQMRDVDPNDLNPAERSARFHYLNKTAFNGLYRTNRLGTFNTPYAYPRSYKPVKPDALDYYGNLMGRVQLEHSPFYPSTFDADSVVYLDPPYYSSKVSSRVDYGCQKFDHIQFVQDLRILNDLGVKFALSHSLNTDFDELVMGQGVVANRHVFDYQYVAAAKPSSRLKTQEILYTNY